MPRIAIVEDDDRCAAQLEGYVLQYGQEHGLTMQVTRFRDGADLVEEYHPLWDILLMDIEMPLLDGMSTARRIRESDRDVLILFITTMGQYAIQGYEVDALDFVLKPVSYRRFATRMDKAFRVLNRNPERYLVLPNGERRERVSARDILYIEVQNHELRVVTTGQVYTMRAALQKVADELEGCHFARCSQSYLVNLQNVTGLGKDTVLLGEAELPVSRPKKKAFLKELSDYLGVGL